MGLGFTLLATVPGTFLLTRLFERPSFAFGLYFTFGGLGGVAGPVLYLWVASLTQNWRAYWLVSLVLVAAAGLLSAVLVDAKTDVRAGADGDTGITREDWPVKSALRTRQFAILAAAYSIFLFVGITVNAVSVAHLMSRGVSAKLAGAMLSTEALINAGARLLGGVIVRWIDAKLLLILSLAALIAGLVALAAAHGTAFDAGLCGGDRRGVRPDLFRLHHPAAGLFRPRPQSGIVRRHQSDFHRRRRRAPPSPAMSRIIPGVSCRLSPSWKSWF